jgi:UDP-N-acetylglucosamine 4-epimerase
MKVLITGGAGFIGSNLVEVLLQNEQVTLVRVLDNLATGHKENIREFEGNPRFEFMLGDTRNPEDCNKACAGIDVISHQAALGSVPRSITDPMTSHDVNVNGFLNMLEAARANNITRVVYASSSSVYGDSEISPKKEDVVGKVLSPYAATKMANELYAEAFSKSYNMTLIGLRYFNVFGKKQDPNGPYAAVIPLFVKAALSNQSPTINGDGSITRDFTPVSNVTQINSRGLFSNNLELGKHYVFNVACGQMTDLTTLWNTIKKITKSNAEANYGPNRKGDIFFSLADVSLAKEILDYEPDSDIERALENTVEYYRD